jgi:DmsE family decaheme c-type cytochrome
MNLRKRWATATHVLRKATQWLPNVSLVIALCVGVSAQADEMKVGQFKLAKADTVLRGDAKCTGCHDESDNPKPTMLGENPHVLSIGKTKHGTAADGRTPTCTTCHGDSTDHMKKPEGTAKRPAPDRMFKKSASPDAQNEACTGCHKGGKHMFWSVSTHAARGVTCANCHSVHNGGHDKVRDKRTQTEVCYTCHKEKRADFSKPSHHPVPEGKMACSDCHNPHGSPGPKQLVKDNVNDTCYQCHAEKRGPFVHNHEPVSDNCATCHNPHGTTAESMLKARPPFLCHQCHTPHGGNVIQIAGQGQNALHPGMTSVLLSATTGGKSGINYFQGRGCLNCHTQVHGSNNPSTANPTPQFMFR